MERIIHKLQSRNIILRKIRERIPLINKLYLIIKKRIVTSVLLKFPPYGMEFHHNYITASWDPVRYGAIALAINNIKKENVVGSIAELGVYQGETSKFIHSLISERKLYLFDTFEGFPLEYLNHNEDTRFKETSIELVKKNFGNLTNIIIKKGKFPETAKGLESEKFSFVSLDADIYLSTLKGLEFFYPRIPKGGYIFIHDYNNPKESDNAVCKAVTEFMADKPEFIIEIPDINGTVILKKLE